MIPDDMAQCPSCGQRAENRSCWHCGISARILDCGHEAQPRPIAVGNSNGQHLHADHCAACAATCAADPLDTLDVGTGGIVPL